MAQPPGTTILYLVRHGQTEANAQNLQVALETIKAEASLAIERVRTLLAAATDQAKIRSEALSGSARAAAALAGSALGAVNIGASMSSSESSSTQVSNSSSTSTQNSGSYGVHVSVSE